MAKETITLKPLQTFEIQTTTVKFKPPWHAPSMARVTQSARILSVYNTTPKHSDPKSRSRKRPDFYIDTEATAPSIHFPFTSQYQSICIYPGTMDVERIVRREGIEEARERMVEQSHAFLDRFMCTNGSIYSSTYPPSTSTSTSSPSASTTPCSKSKLPKELHISSGLGHGKWYDRLLATALDFPPPSGNSRLRSELKWKAFGDDWNVYMDGDLKGVEWEGHGKVMGGGLLLKGKDKVLAMYKPMCGSWFDASRIGEEVNESAPGKAVRVVGNGDGDGVGVLGVLSGEMDDDMCRHVILCAVSIEQQIMRSKGFEPRSYHGCWV